MRCNQRPFKKNKTAKKTPEKPTNEELESFVSNVFQTITSLNSVASSNIYITYNNIYTYKCIFNSIKKPIDINKIHLKDWKRVNPTERSAFFSYFLAANPNYANIFPFTLNLSNEMAESYADLTYPEKEICIRKRLNDEFLHKIHYIPMYSFVIETIPYLHIHGVIQVDPTSREKLREAMKIAAFGRDYAQSTIHRRMLRIEKKYRKTPDHWFRYIHKYESAMESLFMTTSLKRLIQSQYETLRKDLNDYQKSKKSTPNTPKITEEYIPEPRIEHPYKPKTDTVCQTIDPYEQSFQQVADDNETHNDIESEKYISNNIIREYTLIKPYTLSSNYQRLYISYIPPPLV